MLLLRPSAQFPNLGQLQQTSSIISTQDIQPVQMYLYSPFQEFDPFVSYECSVLGWFYQLPSTHFIQLDSLAHWDQCVLLLPSLSKLYLLLFFIFVIIKVHSFDSGGSFRLLSVDICSSELFSGDCMSAPPDVCASISLYHSSPHAAHHSRFLGSLMEFNSTSPGTIVHIGDIITSSSYRLSPCWTPYITMGSLFCFT
ncbi:hypothetical protein BDR07DRAFT_1497518 [Suillus spraguei]|nr:hypothetical protein BDR07DRAFT_1497518 [Suillus spraguei]